MGAKTALVGLSHGGGNPKGSVGLAYPHGVKDDGWVLASRCPVAGGDPPGEVARRVPCCRGAGRRDDHLRASCRARPWQGFVRGISCLSAGSEMRHRGQGRQEGVLPAVPARMQQEWLAVVTQGFISGPAENRETGCFMWEEKMKPR